MKFVLWVPHTSNIILASRCNSSVDAKRLGDRSQLLLFPRRKYVLLAWMGLFLPFAWQDLGREFVGSLKLLLATTGEA